MGMTIKIPVKELKEMDACGKVTQKLKENRDNAYTISGLMVEVFGVKEKDIHNKPFGAWAKGLPSLYTRIRICLEKLQKQGLVKSVKYGKAMMYYWNWIDEKPTIISAYVTH